MPTLNTGPLKEQLQRNRDADAAMKQLLNFYFTEFLSHKDDPAAIEALVAELRADVDAQVAATLENTESAPPEGGGLRSK